MDVATTHRTGSPSASSSVERAYSSRSGGRGGFSDMIIAKEGEEVESSRRMSQRRASFMKMISGKTLAQLFLSNECRKKYRTHVLYTSEV